MVNGTNRKLSAMTYELHPLQLSVMALTLYWGSGSPFSWRVLLALEHKGLQYESQLLHFDKQEHQSPQMLKMNPRGRVPVLKDGDYVVFESVAILYYLDLKYPQPPIFGLTPEEAGVIMRVICEFQAYAEPSVQKIVSAIFSDTVSADIDDLTDAMHVVGREARTIEGRLSKEAVDRRRELLRARHGDFPVDSAAAPSPESQARGRVGRALPAHGTQLPGAGALDSPHRIASRLRTHLSASLAGNLKHEGLK